VFTAFVDSALNIRDPEDYEVLWIRGTGWCQARAHNDFMEKALVWGADLICMLSADQTYDPDVLERLMARHLGGCEVVGGLVPIREDFEENHVGERLAWRIENGVAEKIDPQAAPLQRVDFLGSGLVLFPAGLLEKVSKPWMAYEITGDNWQRKANADTGFFWRLQTEAGAKAWVDTTIKVKHCHVSEIDAPMRSKEVHFEHFRA